ncbi:MAG: hypothetical protein FRX49_07873 [Trebouxia sp. A1-2]|nr:MAG: hypothetical protein FRX49_07873 [Trebouxia sp. A1-2]
MKAEEKGKLVNGMDSLPPEDAAVATSAFWPDADELAFASPDLLFVLMVFSSCLWKRLVSRSAGNGRAPSLPV